MVSARRTWPATPLGTRPAAGRWRTLAADTHTHTHTRAHTHTHRGAVCRKASRGRCGLSPLSHNTRCSNAVARRPTMGLTCHGRSRERCTPSPLCQACRAPRRPPTGARPLLPLPSGGIGSEPLEWVVEIGKGATLMPWNQHDRGSARPGVPMDDSIYDHDKTALAKNDILNIRHPRKKVLPPSRPRTCRHLFPTHAWIRSAGQVANVASLCKVAVSRHGR